MYGEQDYRDAARKLRGRVWISVAIFAVTVGGMCSGLAMRNKLVSTLVPVAGGWALYTYWAIAFLPWFRYNRFLSNMKAGRRREMECYFQGLADASRLVDGVRIHDFTASIDPMGEDTRLFYWDDDKPMPKLDPGSKLRLRSYGNFITDCERL